MGLFDLEMEQSGSENHSFLKDSHKYVLAPMVDQSELAWRILARKYGAHVTFTPMINMRQFVKDPTYRSKAIEFSESDRPCIAQVLAYMAFIF